MIFTYRHWRFAYDPETGMTAVERKADKRHPSQRHLIGNDDGDWVLSDFEQFPTGLGEDEFMDVLDDLAPGRFLS